MITIAICTYNNADRLPRLISELRKQQCPLPFEILVVDNNSSDATQSVIEEIGKKQGASLRCVVENRQGIAFARNRAIEESLKSEYLFFLDDDELPQPAWLSSAIRVFYETNTQCVGGRIRCVYQNMKRPVWLGDELLGFLGEVDYGPNSFVIEDKKKPIWSGNIAYSVSLFKKSTKYRFDTKYNRAGKGIGGGEDAIMFQTLLKDGVKMVYCPEMVIHHYIEPWRLKRRYFLQLHFNAGKKYGQFQIRTFKHSIVGIPIFMIDQAISHAIKTIILLLKSDKRTMRQVMNFAYAIGMIDGRFLSWKNNSKIK